MRIILVKDILGGKRRPHTIAVTPDHLIIVGPKLKPDRPSNVSIQIKIICFQDCALLRCQSIVVEPITYSIQDKYILDITGKSGRPKDFPAGGWVEPFSAGSELIG